jgi:hypothetical protein
MKTEHKIALGFLALACLTLVMNMHYDWHLFDIFGPINRCSGTLSSFDFRSYSIWKPSSGSYDCILIQGTITDTSGNVLKSFNDFYYTDEGDFSVYNGDSYYVCVTYTYATEGRNGWGDLTGQKTCTDWLSDPSIGLISPSGRHVRTNECPTGQTRCSDGICKADCTKTCENQGYYSVSTCLPTFSIFGGTSCNQIAVGDLVCYQKVEKPNLLVQIWDWIKSLFVW